VPSAFSEFYLEPIGDAQTRLNTRLTFSSGPSGNLCYAGHYKNWNWL